MPDLVALQLQHTAKLRQMQIALGEAKSLKNRKDELEKEIDQLDDRVVVLGKVLGLFNSMTEEAQAKQFTQIETIVSAGLKDVIGEALQFKINQTVKGNIPNIYFSLIDATALETNLFGARGGGVLAVSGVLLRTIFDKLLSARVAPVLLLDEPFSQLSAEYVEPMAEVLAQLTKQLGIQVLLVTHQSEFANAADKHYRFGRNSAGRTEVN